MSIQSKDINGILANISSLLDQASEKKVGIDEEALATLLFAVGKSGRLLTLVRDSQVLGAWSDMLATKQQGQILSLPDIWPWIKKFLPKPITAELIRRLGTKDISDVVEE